MTNKSQIANRKSEILTGAYVAFLLLLIGTSAPRRVGDGGEYMAMAMNLAALRPPALSPSDLHRLARRFDEIAHGYEVVPLEMPALRARDGRQDFPHFWLYPLLAVPALWIVNAVGAHPNFAFTALNVAIAAFAFLLLSRRASPAIAVLMLAGPLIWWIDKAHGDVFTVSLMAAGFALLERSPGPAFIALGAAAAQNPPLAPVFALAALAATAVRASTASVRTESEIRASTAPGGTESNRPARTNPPSLERRTMIVPFALRLSKGERWCLAIGAALAALPVLYYEWRLGVPTPIVGWTAFHVPALREAGAFIWDPNIGLAVNHPCFVIAVVGAAIAAIGRRRAGVLTWWLPLACAIALSVGFSQSVNINHGATPGINRWTLWLTPLALPLLMGIRRAGAPARWLGAAALASTIWSVVWFQPARGESYKTPTRTAQRIWSQYAWLDNPPPEIFAERTSGAEPAVVPVATTDCDKVLIVDGAWPVPCLPPLDPSAACAAPRSACYANATASGYAFVPLRMPASLDVHRTARAWPLDGAFAKNLRAALDEAGIDGLMPAVPGQAGSMLRAAHGVPWTYTLQAEDRVFVYAPDAAADAVLTLRLPGPMAGVFLDLDSGERVTSVVRGGEPWAVWDVRVPERKHAALLMKAAR